LFNIIDTTGNTGTGHLFAINTVGTSAAKPLRFSAGGTVNGVEMDTTGQLGAIGTGNINATKYKGGSASGVGSCTNQVVTALSDAAAPTCTTITSAFTSGTFPANAHNLLSSTHSDTTLGTVARGDLVVGQSVTPTWQRLALGAANTYLGSNGTDAAWTAPTGGGTVLGTGRILTGGAGIAAIGDLSLDRTIATASGKADFLASGALTCGAGTQGKMQVHTTPLQYCDNAATPALQYAAYGDSGGSAKELAGLSANGMVARTGAASFINRTITGTASQISVSNGDGVAGNPTIDIGANVLTNSSTR
jgi:hypothetical protein